MAFLWTSSLLGVRVVLFGHLFLQGNKLLRWWTALITPRHSPYANPHLSHLSHNQKTFVHPSWFYLLTGFRETNWTDKYISFSITLNAFSWELCEDSSTHTQSTVNFETLIEDIHDALHFVRTKVYTWCRGREWFWTLPSPVAEPCIINWSE